jgi:hypothetical protein
MGYAFGVIDIIGSVYKNDNLEIENWYTRKDLMKRQFSIMSREYSECMSLSIGDLHRLQNEFQEIYDSLMEERLDILTKILLIKL